MNLRSSYKMHILININLYFGRYRMCVYDFLMVTE